jgi:hypothetical protein
LFDAPELQACASGVGLNIQAPSTIEIPRIKRFMALLLPFQAQQQLFTCVRPRASDRKKETAERIKFPTYFRPL